MDLVRVLVGKELKKVSKLELFMGLCTLLDRKWRAKKFDKETTQYKSHVEIEIV